MGRLCVLFFISFHIYMGLTWGGVADHGIVDNPHLDAKTHRAVQNAHPIQVAKDQYRSRRQASRELVY